MVREEENGQSFGLGLGHGLGRERKRRNMKNVDMIATILVIVGAFNWGLIGLFDFDLIDYVFGRTWLDRLIYVLMGFAAIYKVVNWETLKTRWKG